MSEQELRDKLTALEQAHAEVTAKLETAYKALREIGETAIVDWQDRLVGLVSGGLGTIDWNTVITMERAEHDRAERLRIERDALKADNAALTAAGKKVLESECVKMGDSVLLEQTIIALEVQVATLRHVIKTALSMFGGVLDTSEERKWCLQAEQSLAAQPHPGTALLEEIAALKAGTVLGDDLVAIISHYCGETGVIEGAVDTLHRKLDELMALEALITKLVGALEACTACLHVYGTGGNPNSPYLDGKHPLYVLGTTEALNEAKTLLASPEVAKWRKQS